MKKLLVLFLLVSAVSYGQIPDPLPGTYVNDLAGVLSPQDAIKLNQNIEQLEKKTSIQLAIVLVGDLPADKPIEDFAREIGRKWHVGHAKNGLVYVAAINSHKQRLEVASELEGDITDITALQLTDAIKPFFRNKDYFGGLNNMVNDIQRITDPVAKEQKRLAEIAEEKNNERIDSILLTVFLSLVGLGATIAGLWFLYFLPRKKRKAEEKRKESERLFNEIQRSRQGHKPTSVRTAHTSRTTPRSIFQTPRQVVNNYVAPVVIEEPSKSSSYSSSSSDDSSSSSSSSSWGSWGSSSDSSSSSSDSGFSGGGASNDW